LFNFCATAHQKKIGETRYSNNDKCTAERFAPLSIYEQWKAEGNIPRQDDWIYGYVPDNIFFNAPEKEFENYVMKHFYFYE